MNKYQEAKEWFERIIDNEAYNERFQNVCKLAIELIEKELINTHFNLQLTSSECDLILFCLKAFEEEFGWDATLLIEKIENYKYMVCKQEGVVECVEID